MHLQIALIANVMICAALCAFILLVFLRSICKCLEYVRVYFVGLSEKYL